MAIYNSNVKHKRTSRPGAGLFLYDKALIFCSILGLISCARQAVQTKTTVTAAQPEALPYQIGKDDVIEIIVWKEPQLSGKVRVVGDGTVTVPLVGRVNAEGLTCEQLQGELTKEFAKYTQNPTVMVRVANPVSHVFYILGEVNKPGAYALRSNEVLSQALAEAGGLTPFADQREIRVVRRTRDPATGGELVTQIVVDFHRATHGDLQVDIPLQAGDTVTVP